MLYHCDTAQQEAGIAGLKSTISCAVARAQHE